MYPTLFKLGPLVIHSYGFMVALGFLAAIIISLSLAKRAGVALETIFDLAIWAILAGILGARLFYVLGQWQVYRHNLVEIFMVQRGGLVVLGGIVFGLLAIAGYCRQKKLSFLKVMDVISPGSLLGLAIGRLGCFLNGCCFGLPTKLPWGLVFPSGSLAHGYFATEHLHPTQLYSVLALLLAFVLLLRLYKRKAYAGFVFFWALILYALYRFSVEFLRYSPIHWLNLTPSQWLVLVFFVVGFWGLFTRRREQ